MAEREHDSGDVLARLEAMAPELPEAIEKLEHERALLDEKLKRLRALHRALTGEPAQAPQAKAKAKAKPGRASKPGDEVLARVRDAAMRFEQPFTARELRESMPEPALNESTIHGAIKYMREVEFLGAAGQRRVDGAPRPSQTFRVLDADALEASESRPSLAAVV